MPPTKKFRWKEKKKGGGFRWKWGDHLGGFPIIKNRADDHIDQRDHRAVVTNE